MTKEQRIKVKETKSWDEDWIEVDIQVLVNHLQELLSDGWTGIQRENVYYDTCYELYKWRMETDVEYEARMEKQAKAEAAKARAKEKRRQKYEDLKKEFEQS